MDFRFFIGTYIQSDVKTVYEYSFDTNTNAVDLMSRIDAGPHTSFICANESKDTLYVLNELDRSTHGSHGLVSCLQKNEEGVYIIKSTHNTEGDYPCHVLVNKEKSLLFVSNYGSGTLCVYALNLDGNIKKCIQTVSFSGSSVHAQRQEASHLHQAVLSPSEKYLYVTDLGCDFIYVFTVSSHRNKPLDMIHKIESPTGSGPRHMAFSEDQSYLYISCELSSSVLVFKCEQETGMLTLLQECKAFLKEKDPYPRSSAAEIAVYKNNVYMSNRGDNSISVFRVYKDGSLHHNYNVDCGGKTPRHFKIFPYAVWKGEAIMLVANQDSHNVIIFSIKGENIIKKHGINTIASPAVIC